METIKPGGTSMVAPRKYPEELRERSIRMTLDARQDPASRPSACRRIGEQLGINPETLRGWVTQAEIDAGGRPGTTTAEAAGVDLGLGHPTAQRLRVDPQLLTDPPARAGTRRRVLPGVQRHPDRPLPQFLRVLPRCHHRCSSRLDGLHQTRYLTARRGGVVPGARSAGSPRARR